MPRNIKILGLVMVAVFAISAVAASIASAQGKLTSDGPVTLDITERAGGANALTAFGSKVECPGTVRTGHKTLTTKETEEGKKHELIAVPTTSFTVTDDTPQTQCVAVEGGTTHKATVTTNGCDYDATVHGTVGGGYSQTTEVVCPPGKDMEVEIYAFAGSELGGVACTVTIKPQTGITGATTELDAAADDMNTSGTYSGIAASKSGFGCATEETKTASMDVHTTTKGTNAAGGTTGFTVTD